MDSIPSTSKTDYINTEEEDNIKEDNAKEEETIEEGERQDWNDWITEDNFVVEEMEIDDENNDDIINALNRDIETVKLLLTGMNAIPSDEEIYAYLEAHVYDRNRIRIVVDELSGVNTSPSHSREPSPIRILEDGKGKKSIDANIEKFVQSVLEIVPKIDVKYLREQATDFVGQDAAIERFIEGFLDGPQVQEEDEMDPFEEWQREQENYLVDAFPYISPEWIRDQIESFRDVHGTDNVQFSEKAIQMVELMEKDKSIPTRKDWEKKIKLREEIDKWSKNITVNDMIELYDGNPEPHFIGPNVPKSDLYIKHSLAGLWDAFKFTKVVSINREHKRAKYSFAEAYKELERLPATRMNPRMDKDQIKYPADPCIQFVKERKFVELRTAIEAELKKRETERRQALEEARLSNSLVECGCCFNDECLVEDMVSCKAGHLYCKECIQRSTNVAMGEGNTIIRCLGQCEEEIPTKELQKAVHKNVLSKLLIKRQAEEVGASEIENLVTCPYCPYATIMENQEDKVVVCRNPDCGRTSCRLCQRPSHVPFRCDEQRGNMRKQIEESLSDAIIRKCSNPQCSTTFLKDEGCNRMICPKCKTTQCYVCKKTINGYDHFHRQGGRPDNIRTCPLYSDMKELYAAEIQKATEKEVKNLKNDGIDIKFDKNKGIVSSDLLKEDK